MQIFTLVKTPKTQGALPQRTTFGSQLARAALSIIMSTCCYAEVKPPLKIGVITGVGGPAAKWNRFQNMGITLAQEDYLAENIPVSVIFEDAQTQAPKAISAFNKLLNFNKVDAILGDDFGFALAPLLPLTKQRNMLFVALSLPHDHYCKQSPTHFFSITSQFENSRSAYEQFFIQHPEVKKIALVVFDDPEWGNTYRKIWVELAQKFNVEIVDTFLSSEWTPDYKSALVRILAHKPDAIFQAHEPESFFKALRATSYTGKVVIANHVFEMLADSPTGRKELADVFVVDVPVNEDFRKRFIKRFGVPPILEAYAGYEGLRALVKAFQANKQHPERGMRALRYQGIAGEIDFTQTERCAGNKATWGLFKFNKDGLPEGVN